MTAVTPPRRASGRLAALDGLRAVAVLAVVLYHVDHTLVPGGFIGVDLFFVLSGYLITTLLVTERQRHGAISLRAFWGRRVRRLWPLAWVTLAAIALASPTGVWGADRQRTVPSEILASLAQVANWYQIDHGGYVRSAVAPSPVRHFWSLAIEEQFYVVWPLLLAGLLAWSTSGATPDSRPRRWVVPATLTVLGAASVGAGWWHASSPDRAYLGTDVRLVALVIGAGLAWALRGRPMRGPSAQWARVAVAVAGPLGAVAFFVGVVTLHADSPALPRWGFAAVAVVSAAIVAFALTPNVVSAALSWPPLVWLGRISFALYLVHWPLLVALGPDRSLPLRLLVGGPVAVVVAAGLHRLVELPMIDRSVPWPRVTAVVTVLASVAVLALVIAVPEGETPTERVRASLSQVPDPTTRPSTTAVPATGPTGATDGATGGPVATTTTTTPCAAPGSTATDGDTDISASENSLDDPSAAACGDQLTVLVVGDSTGRGAANGLAKLADPRLVLWDRTILGCSYGGEDCPDWRTAWQLDVEAIDPDVVLVYSGVVSDLRGFDDEPFLSEAEGAERARVLDEASSILGASGARIVFTVPAVPLRPNGLFFCDGRSTGSNCDPAWVQRWSDDVRGAALRNGAAVADVAQWTADRGNDPDDRPDGLHYSRTALRAQAEWLVPQILLVGAS